MTGSNFTIEYASGVRHQSTAATLTGAQREATRELSHGGGSVTILDRHGDPRCRRVMWTVPGHFGWHRWQAM
jgi:hypothetical protein